MAITLRPGEQKLYEAKLHWSTYLGPIGWLALGVIILVAALVGIISSQANLTGATYLSGVLFWLLMFIHPLVLQWLTRNCTEYVITDQRVYVERGILNKSKLDIPLPKVNDLELTQGLLQRIMNTGNVRILTGNDQATVLSNLDNPEEFRSAISEQISTRRTA